MSESSTMHKIKMGGLAEESIVDGPGLRFTIFTQGCSHHCPGCHNPQTHDPDGGFWEDGDTLLTKILSNPLLSGVTLSGGEPFEQAENLLPLARAIKEHKLELAAYTGYVFEDLVSRRDEAYRLLSLCDVLVDGPFILTKRNLGLRFRGSENQRLIDVKKSLEQGYAVEIRDGRWQ